MRTVCCEGVKLALLRGGRNIGCVIKNRVLRKIFGPKMVEVPGELKEVHNEQFYHLHSSLNIIRVIKSRRMKWAWHVGRMGRGVVHIGLWWGRPECKRPFGRPRHRWKDNINVDVKEMGGDAWTGFIWLRIGTGGGRV